VLDGDLGESGCADWREGTTSKVVVTDVSMRKGGGGLCAWRLTAGPATRPTGTRFGALAFTDTLMIDEDGCYNPADFKRPAVVGIKGTMSQAELHFLRGRLQGGKSTKAKRAS